MHASTRCFFWSTVLVAGAAIDLRQCPLLPECIQSPTVCSVSHRRRGNEALRKGPAAISKACAISLSLFTSPTSGSPATRLHAWLGSLFIFVLHDQRLNRIFLCRYLSTQCVSFIQNSFWVSRCSVLPQAGLALPLDSQRRHGSTDKRPLSPTLCPAPSLNQHLRPVNWESKLYDRMADRGLRFRCVHDALKALVFHAEDVR